MKYLQIVLEYPDDVTIPKIKQYAQDALEGWAGVVARNDNPKYLQRYKTKAPKSKMKALGNVRKPRTHSDRIA